MTPADIPVPSVPDHELLRQIGRGSYGEVWLARNVMGSWRAVKVVRRSSFDSDRPYDREFGGLQQFEPVSRSHPGLVSILHIGRNAEAGYFYCVMEAADDCGGGAPAAAENYQPRTLAGELARRGRLPMGECVELGIGLCGALGHLHAGGLVHRDLKPSNIIFVDRRPKLADIGLVTRIGAKATFVGTEGYLPPEGPGTAAADLYSLGKVLYEISTGKSADQFPELPTQLRDWPESEPMMRFNEIVLRACAPQPERRYHSAGDLRRDLEALASRWNVSREAQRTGAGLTMLILALGGTEAEQSAASNLAGRWRAAGNTVLVEEQPEVSVAWARRLEEQIRQADAVIPLLSRASVRSELLAYALEVAALDLRRPGRQLVVAPVAVDPQGSLPRQVAVALGGVAPVGAQEVEEIICRTPR